MPRVLPLFPLDTVLFPGSRAALHIFEPRYQRLLADVLQDGGEFGILPPGDDGGPPPTGSLGCVARVEVHQPLPDGRSQVIVIGQRRFVLSALASGDDTPYLRGAVDEFDDESSAEPVPADADEALRRLAARCRVALAELTGLSNDTQWPDDTAALTFRIASELPWDVTQARHLLGIRSATARTDILLQLLPRIVPELEARAAVHARAPSNGKGHHGAEIVS